MIVLKISPSLAQPHQYWKHPGSLVSCGFSPGDAGQQSLIPYAVALEPAPLGYFLGFFLGIPYAVFAMCGTEIITLLVIGVCSSNRRF